MCGIAGFCYRDGRPAMQETLTRMTNAIAHRGPDGEGFFTYKNVGLGVRRLAIIDLKTGDQPISNPSGDITIVFNGELYNFQEIKQELEQLGHVFFSKSDTEVVVQAYEQWGKNCVKKFNGMFGFAICDQRKGSEQLFIARDRFGVKPIYYSVTDEGLIFGSEIKSILAHPGMEVAMCYPALREYFTFQNIFSDFTLFENVRTLAPGHTLSLELKPGAEIRVERFWDFDFTSNRLTGDREELSEELYRLFESAVTRQLISDVPVGSYLSGGMDSTSITAVAARHIPRIHTFTGGFDLSSASGLELAFDERPVSERMSNLFKTEHYEIVMHAGDMEHILPKLIWHLEDLRVGQSYPNFYAAGLASKFVKVVLSGTGGDELFAGYPWRYYRNEAQVKKHGFTKAYYGYWQRLVPDEEQAQFYNKNTFDKVSIASPYESFVSVFDNYKGIPSSVEDLINASLYFETRTFLNGLLIVEDKLSMAHSLETRVPFLDNDLIDFAMAIPARYKLDNLIDAPVMDEDEPGKMRKYHQSPSMDGKVILRDAMKRLIPDEIRNRNKQGFSAPDASWFRGESIDYINQLLRDPKAQIREFFNPTYIDQTISEHTSGKVNHRLLIWSLLSFEWWLKTFKPVR
jgi:asparagine synthase (glutamine-hydrolysing)